MGVAVKVLDRKRSDYRPDVWRDYRILAQGGHALEAARDRFMPRNPAESHAWYSQRLSRFEYKNIAGTILSDYSASIFRAPLEMMLAKDDSDTRPNLSEWWLEFIRDPKGDGDGSFSDLMACQFEATLQTCENWVMVAMPETVREYASRFEQEASGDLDAKLQELWPENVINYGWDSQGLSWIRLRFEIFQTDELGSISDERRKIRWLQIDRKIVRTFEITIDKGEKEPGPDDEAVELPAYAHKLADAREGSGMVPVIRLQLKPKLWMLDKIASVAKSELRKRNELSWYESLACIPQLVLQSDDDGAADRLNTEGQQHSRKRGVQYLYQVGRQDILSWLEITGSSLEHLAKRLDLLEGDVYKAVSQMATSLGVSSSAAVMARSGASKARDAATKIILCTAYAMIIRDWAVQIFECVASARRELDLDWEASGLDQHDTIDPIETAEWFGTASMVSAKSETGRKELEKRYWRQMLPDADPATMDEIEKEVDEATFPDPDEMLDMERQARTGTEPGPEDE